MELERMKRKQLQGLCKKHGIPANLSSREMVDRLSLRLKTRPVVAKKVKFSPENDETFVFEDESKRKMEEIQHTKKTMDIENKGEDSQNSVVMIPDQPTLTTLKHSATGPVFGEPKNDGVLEEDDIDQINEHEDVCGIIQEYMERETLIMAMDIESTATMDAHSMPLNLQLEGAAASFDHVSFAAYAHNCVESSSTERDGDINAKQLEGVASFDLDLNDASEDAGQESVDDCETNKDVSAEGLQFPETPKNVHKVHDMKENPPTTAKAGLFGTVTASTGLSSNRRPLQDLPRH